jgi:flagellar FliP-like protein
VVLLFAAPAVAQDVGINFGQGPQRRRALGPALQRAYDNGVKPLVANQITAEQAFQRGSEPLRAFMQKNVREKDLKLFVDIAKEPEPEKADDLSLRVLVPAFMISQLRRASEIGFLLVLPFLIIDLVVASVLDVDRHHDAAAGGRLVAVQAHLLRARRRLEPCRGLAHPELRDVELIVIAGLVPAIHDFPAELL